MVSADIGLAGKGINGRLSCAFLGLLRIDISRYPMIGRFVYGDIAVIVENFVAEMHNLPFENPGYMGKA